MKALRLYGPQDLRLEDVPDPVAGPRDVVVRVLAAGICGSDIRNYWAGGSDHGYRLPRTLGHEVVGEVVEVGPEAPGGLRVGDRIATGAVIPCGQCRPCRRGYSNICRYREAIGYQVDGGFAQYMRVPGELLAARNWVRLDEGVPVTEAVFAEALACAVNGQQITGVRPGDVVVILGAGPLGLLHIMLARLYGAESIIAAEFDETRRQLAERCGADVVVSAEADAVREAVREATAGEGADVVIVAAPADAALSLALELAALRGRINFFAGMPKGKSQVALDANLIHYRELRVDSASDSTGAQLRTAVNLISRRAVDVRPLISRRLSLENATEGFERSPGNIKSVIIPD